MIFDRLDFAISRIVALFRLGFVSGGEDIVIVVSMRRRRVGMIPDVVILWGSSLQRAEALLTACRFTYDCN